MALCLYEHNQKAYEAAMAMLEASGKTAILHPTGTGKSFKLAKEHSLILDVVNNFENLHCIRSIETEFEEALRSVAGTKGFLEKDREHQNHFQIIDETHDAWELFRGLQEKLDADWDDYYTAAKAYRDEMGNLEIAAGFVSPSGLPVGSWLQTQCRIYMGKIPGTL